MILSQKILNLRKKNGWSQEELAEKLNVSRQSISKWESTASIPDISKIIDMASLFGVTTDYLLKDNIEEIEYTGEDTPDDKTRVRVSIQETNEFMETKKSEGVRVGIGAALCVLSPILFIILGYMTENNPWGNNISEALAAGIGVPVLLIMVAIAVGIFISNGFKTKRFEYLTKTDFELEYGVAGIVKNKQHSFEHNYIVSLITGVTLCVLCSVPLIVAGASGASGFTCVLLLSLLLAMVAIAVYLFISFGNIKTSYDLLLREGDYSPEEVEANKAAEKIGGIYWPIIVAGYLAWSFISGDWQITWIVWPIAGILFGGISAAMKIKK
ncbi:MAG: helix-turn-helix domain-containing protein [Oscillospiraceae bacterium]|nr:helix-turn-helix domain-containing protein [Oscillospiraceae bacterium]